MEKKPKLGRGLDEVSHYYLSTVKKGKPDLEKMHKERRHVVRVYHSCSDTIQSFFLSNLALELAKCQLSIDILDCCDNKEINIKSKMKRLIKNEGQSSEYSVDLYGLPSIHVHEADPYDPHSVEHLIDSININSNNGYIFINTKKK